MQVIVRFWPLRAVLSGSYGSVRTLSSGTRVAHGGESACQRLRQAAVTTCR
jgi:hypothetical protein